jgi:hypothetical protein
LAFFWRGLCAHEFQRYQPVCADSVDPFQTNHSGQQALERIVFLLIAETIFVIAMWEEGLEVWLATEFFGPIATYPNGNFRQSTSCLIKQG